ncbi:hypothetical protein D3C71_21920 [compost metagenome]
MRTQIRLHIQLSQSQLRDSAMREQGLCPRAMSVKLGTRVERNRKSAEKRGYAKHRGRCFD